MERQVVHVNVANFMASVEAASDPALRGEPFVVARGSGGRSIVLDLSDRAYREGLRRGQTLTEVRRLGKIRVLEPRFHIYSRAEAELLRLADPMAPVVERISGGHLFCDITGTRSIFGNPLDHALRLRREISSRLGLEPVVSLAANRLVSKVATRVVKPRGFVSVMAGDERDFLRHQDVELLPGVGENLLRRMRLLGIREAGTLADLDDGAAAMILGRLGRFLRDSARGMDTTPVISGALRDRIIAGERIFDADTDDMAHVMAHLYSMAEEAGCQLRQNSMLASALEVSLTYTDGATWRARRLLGRPSFCDRDFFDTGRGALASLMGRRVRLRGLSLSLTDISESGRQLELFESPGDARRESLQRSIDIIRSRYGRTAISVGYALGGGR